MFEFNISSILPDVGLSLEIEETSKIDVVGNGIGVFNVTKPVELKGKFINVGNNIIDFIGNVSTEFEIPCDRCTAIVKYPADINISQKFSMDFKDTDNYEVEFIDGYIVNLYPIVLDELKLNIPMKVLCKPDCKGLCSVCGKNLNEGTCDCEPTDIDPRLSGLKDLFSNK